MAESATADAFASAIGDRDAPTPGCVEIDSLIACADGAGYLEIRKQCHLVAA